MDEPGSEDARQRRENAARQFLDAIAMTTEHQNLTKTGAVREICESAIKIYDGTEDQYVADWAREVLRLMDEHGLWGRGRPFAPAFLCAAVAGSDAALTKKRS